MKIVKPALSFLALALLGSLTWNSPASASDRKPTVLPAKVTQAPALRLPTRPCADDSDDVNCYWDAAKRGNGKGYSYYVDRAGNVTYLNPKLNDPAKRKAWKAANEKAKREYWGTVWGHRLCWAKVGDTSYVFCFDGFKETS
ncbi:hypothetical protein P1P75_01215 [Streptomyces sp. ID05-39B]|uniref:hypothetical protein n=1 Tax=Streptomyces sp. ID05-39B TaxID=3028664 RepID=UPI0029B90309|nr:hypothetical protein [Streptomyces sp. ID05-39B]MDX3525102.1 hypothetical protein [Streptomyces sp. ID05-39B]